MKQRLIRISVALIIGLILSAAIAAYQVNKEKSENFIAVTAKNFGGPFTLVNQEGEIVTEKDFEGQWRMLYFGFTFCPAICPTELQKMTTVLNELREMGDVIQPVFISVDPERDTVDIIKNYISLFHPRFIGLTGSTEQVEQVKKSYKVYAAKVQDETMTDYTVDHSSFIYFMNPNNDLVRIFRIEDTVDDMVNVIEQALIAYKSE